MLCWSLSQKADQYVRNALPAIDGGAHPKFLSIRKETFPQLTNPFSHNVCQWICESGHIRWMSMSVNCAAQRIPTFWVPFYGHKSPLSDTKDSNPPKAPKKQIQAQSAARRPASLLCIRTRNRIPTFWDPFCGIPILWGTFGKNTDRLGPLLPTLWGTFFSRKHDRLGPLFEENTDLLGHLSRRKPAKTNDLQYKNLCFNFVNKSTTAVLVLLFSFEIDLNQGGFHGVG